jgi:hypothetical protein
MGRQAMTAARPNGFDGDAPGGDAPKRSFEKAPEFEEPTPRGKRKAPSAVRSRATVGKPSLKEPVGGMLVMLNLPVQMFAPRDALDPAEIDTLATGIDEQAKLSPRFRRYVEMMIGIGTGGQLLSVAGMIAARRMARHGFLGEGGENVDGVLGKQLSTMANGEAFFVPPYPVKDEGQTDGSAPAYPPVS